MKKKRINFGQVKIKFGNNIEYDKEKITMLSNEKVKKALEDKEIEITVSFGFKEGVPVSYEKEEAFLSSSLKDNLYSDRLKLTMGPLVKVLNKKRVKSKYRFKSERDCFDLRKANNRYIISPGESIVVLTNEKIKLNGKYACLIVPRISMSDVGIVVTTAYVDPFYNGVMRLHLSNLSDKSYELKFLESIAQCFFFELSDLVSEKFEEEFSMKSVFLGQTWNGILNSDRNPFPTKKEEAHIDKLSNLKYQINILNSIIKKHSLVFLLFTNMVVILCGIAAFKQTFTKYTVAMEQVEAFLEPTSSEIMINAGELYGEKEITVEYAKSDIVSVLCNNDEIHYKILSGNKESETKIIFSFYLTSPPTDKYEVNFTYVIVRRIK